MMFYEHKCNKCEAIKYLVEEKTCDCGGTFIYHPRDIPANTGIIMKDKNNWYAAGVDKPIFNKKKGGNIAVPNRPPAKKIKVYC